MGTEKQNFIRTQVTVRIIFHDLQKIKDKKNYEKKEWTEEDWKNWTWLKWAAWDVFGPIWNY